MCGHAVVLSLQPRPRRARPGARGPRCTLACRLAPPAPPATIITHLRPTHPTPLLPRPPRRPRYACAALCTSTPRPARRTPPRRCARILKSSPGQAQQGRRRPAARSCRVLGLSLVVGLHSHSPAQRRLHGVAARLCCRQGGAITNLWNPINNLWNPRLGIRRASAPTSSATPSPARRSP